MHSRTAIVASLSHIPEDGRILRHCRQLAAAGYRVVALGLPRAAGQARQLPQGCADRYELISPVDWSAAGRLNLALALLAARAPLPEDMVVRLGLQVPGARGLLETLSAVLAEEARGARCVVIANDWMTLPAVLAARASHEFTIHYDTHELATEEFAFKPRWRLLFPPLIAKLERLAASQAQSISCVSQGISDAMARLYGLRQAPSVVINLPDVPPLQPRPVGRPIKVLYHGLLMPKRGLELLIESASLWPADFQLILRGSANDAQFGLRLESLARGAVAAKRIVLEAMAPVSDVVGKANDADIGIFLPEGSLRQNSLALPNKLFEYLYAGLLPIVPARSEMGSLLAGHGIGLSIDEPSPRALADLIGRLKIDEIARGKAAAHRVALELAASSRQGIVASL